MFIWQVSLVGVVLELKCVIETNPIRVSYHCISYNSFLKQLYISNKTEHFSYKSGYGLTHIETFKKELAWVIDNWLQFIINMMLFKKLLY